MQPTKNTGRVAGLLYTVMGIPAVFTLVYVPHVLIVPGNATVTANNILASEMLFRGGIVCQLMNGIVFIFLVRTLYRLFDGVDKRYASLMVTLALLSVPIMFLNELNQVAALTLLRGADFLAVLGEPQRQALAMMFLHLHGQGVNLAAIFWGLWLFPFGVLVMRSGFLPRILGILLIVNSFAYPAVTLASLLWPSYVNVVNRVVFIPELGELWIMQWLLIRGANLPLAAAAS